MQSTGTVAETVTTAETSGGLLGLFIMGLILARIMKKGSLRAALTSVFLVALTSYGSEANLNDIPNEYFRNDEILFQNPNITVYIKNNEASFTRLKYSFFTMIGLIFCCAVGIMIFYLVAQNRIRRVQRNLLPPNLIHRDVPGMLEDNPQAAGINNRRESLVHGREGRMRERRNNNVPDETALTEQAAGSPTPGTPELAVAEPNVDQPFIISAEDNAVQPPSPPTDTLLEMEYLV